MAGGKKRKLETEAAAAAAAAAAAVEAAKKESSSEGSSSEDEESSSDEEEEQTTTNSENKSAKSIFNSSVSKPASSNSTTSSAIPAAKVEAPKPQVKAQPVKTASQSQSSSSESESSSEEEEEEEEEEEKAPSPPKKKRKKGDEIAAPAVASEKKACATHAPKASSKKKKSEVTESPTVAPSPAKKAKDSASKSAASAQSVDNKKKKTIKDAKDVPAAARAATTSDHVVNGEASKDQQPNENPEWTDDSTRRLLSNISDSLPDNDVLKYQTQQEKLVWEDIAFDGFDAVRCKAKWVAILKSMRTFKTMRDLVGEALRDLPEDDAQSDSAEDAEDESSYPDPLWIQFFQSKCKELGGKRSNGKKVSYFKRLTEKFESMPVSEKEEVRQQQLEDMTAFMSKLNSEKTSEEEAEKETNPRKPIKVPAKPHTPVNIFMNYAKEKVKNSAKSKELSTQELIKRLREQWKKMGNTKKIRFVLQSIEALQEYEKQVREIKAKNARFLTDHIPDTVHVLSKEDIVVYEEHLGVPHKPPKTGYSAFTQEKLLSGKYNEIEPAGRMAKIALLWKELTEEEKTVMVVKTKSAWEAFHQAVNGLPEESRKLLEALWKSHSSPSASTTAPQDSKPPQKPFDAIRVYIDDKKEKFAKKNPDLNASEINRRLTVKYNELDEDKKNKYKKKALAMKEEYQRELRDRDPSGGSTTKETPPPPVKGASASKSKEKKPPMNGYSLYSQECMRNAEMMKGIENKMRMGHISVKWKALTDAERQSYIDRSKTKIDEYIAANPNSDFAKTYVNKTKKSTSSTGEAAADADVAPAEPTAKPKNKMLDGLVPSATSTPKRAVGIPKASEDEEGEEEGESDEEESEDESQSESESEDESSSAAKQNPPASSGAAEETISAPKTSGAAAVDKSDESSSEEESSDDEEEKNTAAASISKVPNGTASTKQPAKQESSEEESSDEDDD